MDLGNMGLMLFVPLLASIAKQSGWPDNVNRLVAILIYLLWGAVVTLMDNPGGNPQAFIENFALTLTIGSVAYQRIWSAFGVDDQLEEWTSFKKAPREDVVIEG